jgi:Ala-tRNA(Pro) deacylase
MEETLELLKKLNIAFELYEHEAVFTNIDSGKVAIAQVAENAKNLFLRAEKTHQFYLLTIDHGKKADLKAFAKTVGEKGFSFGKPEELLEHLKLTPGSVSPLGLMNDAGCHVKYYIDEDLLKKGKIYVHPNINTATVGITAEDLIKFLRHTGHELHTVQI